MKFYYYLIFTLLIGCGTSSVQNPPTKKLTTELKYAKGFSLQHKGNKTLIEVYNPWKNYSLMASYELVKCNDSVTTSANTICVPVQRTTCLSSTYLGMISLFNERETVVASSNANWIYDSVLYDMYLKGKIINLGNDMNVGAEAVIATKPDVVLKYIYQSPDPIDPVVTKSGLPLVYIIEFMEEHPLGRAEWIKLIGALLGKEEMADSIFSKIEKDYLHYTKLAQEASEKPKVLCGSIYKGTWYAVGGQSYMARLLRDANANYYWFSDSTTGSLPLSFESVIHKQSDAEYWINANATSLNDLLAIDSRNNVFKAYREGNVYHYNKRLNDNGGLDYYETGVVRPDLLLRDLLVILHPGLLDSETVYYKKLKNIEAE